MQFEPAAALIGLREGLEALVVTGILLGMMKRFGHAAQARWVWLGALAGLAAAVLFGGIVRTGLQAWYDAGGADVLELTTGLVALAILTYMVLWMQRHTMGMMGSLRAKVAQAVEGGRWGLIASLSFFMVFREGVETVLFFAAKATEVGWSPLAASGALGFGLSALLAYAIFRLSLRIDFERFFAVTGFLLILLAAGVLVGTVGAAEAVGESHGWFTATAHAWDTSATLPDEGNWLGNLLHVFVGYVDHPSWAQVVAYVAFVGGMGLAYALSLRHRPAPPSRET
jgi:high-affinity iron transporter